MGQHQGLAKEHALLGAADGKGVAQPGQLGQGQVAGLAHETVAQAGAVHIEEQAAVSAGRPDGFQLSLGIQGAVFRGLGDIHHGRLDHVLVGDVPPVVLMDPANIQGGELAIPAGYGQNLVAVGLNGPGLVDGDVAAGSGDDPLVGPQGSSNDRRVGLGAAHQEVDVQAGVFTQIPDVVPGPGAVVILAVARGLL